MKLVYQEMVIFFNFSPTSSHLHQLQVENRDSNSRLVVDEDDNGKFRLERVNEGVSANFLLEVIATTIGTATVLCAIGGVWGNLKKWCILEHISVQI